MKSKTSYFSKIIYKKNLTHFWPVWVIFVLYQMIILPFTIYTSYLNVKAAVDMSQKELAVMKMNNLIFSVETFISPGSIFIMSLVTAMAVFSYLYSTRSANMLHAMPVTRKELFITNYLSGITVLIVPQVLAFVAAIFVSAACGYTNLVYLLQGLFYALGLSFFFFSLCVFAAMITGHILGLPLFALAVNFLYIGLRMIFSMLSASLVYGIQGEYRVGKLDVLSPLYYMLSKVGIEYGESGGMTTYNGIVGGEAIAGYCVAAVAFIIAAYVAYQRRRMENAGSLISIPWMRPIFRWGFGICGTGVGTVFICNIFGNHISKELYIAIAAAIAAGAICFFAGQMLLEKNFAVFQKNRIRECGIFLMFAVVALIGIETDVFGQEKKIPNTEDVERAYVSLGYMVGGSDKQQIEDVRQIHEQMIQSKKEFESFAEDNSNETSHVSVKYILKDGTALTRIYFIPADDASMEASDSLYSRIADSMKTETAFMSNYFCVNYKDISILNGSMEIYGEEGRFTTRYFNAEEAELLYQALQKDLKAGNMNRIVKNASSNNKKYEEETYYNSLHFEYYCKDGIVQIWDYYNTEIMRSGRRGNYVDKTNSAGAGIAFDENCVNIIEALKEIGAIKGKENLITIKEKLDQETAEESR